MSDERKGAGGGLSVQTLVISSLSAVAATLIVSQFWESGTLLFTAMVPIVVALVSEALKRPAQKITQVAPLVVPARRSPTGTAVYEEAPGERPVPEEARRALPGREDRFGLYEAERGRPRDPRRWLRVGLVTGLVAFLIGAAAVTASELAIFGGSVGGGDRRTTYFGGGTEKRRDAERREREDPAAPATTPTPTPAPAEPEEEATPAPDEQAPEDPEATATPAPTTTPPPATTPPPVEEDPAAP